MNLTEIIKNHPVIILAGIFASGIGLGWKVINNVKVEPLEKRISYLTQDTKSEEGKISDLENRIKELEGQLELLTEENLALSKLPPPGTASGQEERELKKQLSKYKAVCNSIKVSNYFSNNEAAREQLMTHCK